MVRFLSISPNSGKCQIKNIHKVRLKLLILLLGIALLSEISVAQNNKHETGIFLFTDRSFCTSGDTVWVQIKLPVEDGIGNVVHLQLDNLQRKNIANLLIESLDKWGEGYIQIPDSLKTGSYFLTAWIPDSKTSKPLSSTRLLVVYNRFDENPSQIELPAGKYFKNEIPSESVELKTASTEFRTREKVETSIDAQHGFEIERAVVKATLTDNFSNENLINELDFEPINAAESGFIERNGTMISGKVTDYDGNPQYGVMVILSLGDANRYFDYFITNGEGLFHFYIKNAYGNAELIFQVYSGIQKEYKIDLISPALKSNSEVESHAKFLTAEEAGFAKTAIQSSFVRRLFTPTTIELPDSLQMPENIPFFGTYTTQTDPALFVDLPNFREISRELLGGLQYRDRNEEINIRILNLNTKKFFEDEPIKLINGIPVTDNRIVARLKSTDIKSIGLVKYERIYGDIVMNGVLDIRLFDKSNKWLDGVPNVFRFKTGLIQTPKNPSSSLKSSVLKTEPDLRQVLYWQKVTGKPENFSFILSDRKGTVEISVEGITKQGSFFKASKKIVVQ